MEKHNTQYVKVSAPELDLCLSQSNLGSRHLKPLQPNFSGGGGGGDCTAPGPDTRKCEGRSYTVFPVLLQRYSSEDKLIHECKMEITEDDFNKCIYTLATLLYRFDFKPLQTLSQYPERMF